MRICHVSPHLPPDQAANALLPAELGRWAHAAGHDVSFLAIQPRQGGAVAEPLPGVVRRLDDGRGPTLLRRLRIETWRRARAFGRALDEVAGRADVLHLHSNGLLIEVAAHWARRRGRPFVLTLYGTEIWHYRRRWPVDPFRTAYMTASAVTFYSQGLLDKARELGLERSELSVVYPAVRDVFQPVDPAGREALRRDLRITEPLVILNVKRLHELAGQTYLIDAFAKLSTTRRDVRLVICGTGQLRESLEAQARDRGVADLVTFAGLVPNDVVAKYAAVADVFALPSLLEALPTVAVEALAAGTPVVSADHPGGVELNRVFGDDVRVVAKGDVEGLEAALSATLAAQRRATAETARIVVDRFSPTAVFEAYERIYRALPVNPGA